MDNHSSHADLVGPQGKVTVTEYPPNCTAKHQLMDRGIVAGTKTITKTRYFAARVAMMEAAPKLREQAKARKMKVGTMGLAEGFAPHIPDAMEPVDGAWKDVTPLTI